MDNSNLWLWLTPLGVGMTTTLLVIASATIIWWWTKPKPQVADHQQAETGKTAEKDAKVSPAPEEKKDKKTTDKDTEKKKKDRKERIDRLAAHLVWALTIIAGSFLLWYFEPWQEYNPVLAWSLITFLGLVGLVAWRYDAEQKKLEWWPGLVVGLGAITAALLVHQQGLLPIAQAKQEAAVLSELADRAPWSPPTGAKVVGVTKVTVEGDKWSEPLGAGGMLPVKLRGQTINLTQKELSRLWFGIRTESGPVKIWNPLSETDEEIKGTMSKDSVVPLQAKDLPEVKFQSIGNRKEDVTVFLYIP